jgi:hypothetical protein
MGPRLSSPGPNGAKLSRRADLLQASCQAMRAGSQTLGAPLDKLSNFGSHSVPQDSHSIGTALGQGFGEVHRLLTGNLGR